VAAASASSDSVVADARTRAIGVVPSVLSV
jgi:hypothetical protein